MQMMYLEELNNKTPRVVDGYGNMVFKIQA